MTQLEIITSEIFKIKTGPATLLAWKKAITDGNSVALIKELRLEAKENREWLVNALDSEIIVQMIEQFDALKEAEVYIGDLMELYKERKDLRDWNKIRVKVAECNMLLEMAGTKLK